MAFGRTVLGAAAAAALVAGCVQTENTTQSADSSAQQPSGAAGGELGPGTFAVIDGEPAPVPDIEMGDPAVIERVIAEAKTSPRVMEHLSTLSLEFGARLTGSSTLERANRWAADRFRSWGLENVEVRQWGTVPVRFDRLESSGLMFLDGAGEGTEVDFTTLAWVKGTDGPTRGEAVPFPESYEAFDSNPERYEGAWVLHEPQFGRRGSRSSRFLMSQREVQMREIAAGGDIDPRASRPPVGSERWAGSLDIRIGEGDETTSVDVIMDVRRGRGGVQRATLSAGGSGFEPVRNIESSGNEMTGEWTTPNGELEVELAFEGDDASGTASGETLPAGSGTLTLTKQATGSAENESRPSLLKLVMDRNPAGFVSSSQDERVWTSAARGWSDRELNTYAEDIEVNIDGPSFDFIMARMAQGHSVDLEFNLNNRVTPGPIPVYNTIAEIPGTTKPDEVVIFSAHLDSWNGPGSMGSTDNGTGSSVVMEAARLLAKAGAEPERTIRFILWTGEEQGLLGARAYVASLSEEERSKISAAFVDDGGTNFQGGVPAADFMVDYFAAATAPINGNFHSETDRAAQLFDDDPSNDWSAGVLNVNVRPTGDQLRVSGGSDHMAFNAVGIPGFFWDEIGRANYRRGWHTQLDRIDLAIPEYLAQSAANSAVVMYNLATAPGLLPREPGPAVADAE